MSAMEQMALSVLQKLIPKETLDLFTKENIDGFISSAKAFKETLEQNLNSIADEQTAQRAMLEELLQNAGHNSKRQPGRRTPVVGADTGNGNDG